MRKMTEGSIPGHVIAMSIPTAVGLIVQTLYYLVDLYFVAALGDEALAGVSAAGIALFVVLALTPVLGVGTVTLISHAVGRDDRQGANLVFNQSLVMAGLGALLTLLLGYGLGHVFMAAISADTGTAAAGTAYLHWFIPCLAMQFLIAAMGSALRGTGIVKPTMVVQMLTVLANIVLAPVLIAGWGTGLALGVAGAGLASSLAALAGVLLMWGYFSRLEKYVGFDRGLWRPDFAVWRRMLAIGLPAGGEFALMFVYLLVVYGLIQDFGAAAQAGFGLGSRIMQAVFLPAMAIAFSAPAVAGQNFGAGRPERVRETFRVTIVMSCTIMALVTALCQLQPGWLIEAFTADAQVAAVGTTYLGIISWNFVAIGIIFTCSGMFQALGNTWPSMLSTATRLLTFIGPALWLASRPGFELSQLWMLSVATVLLQALLSYLLLQREFRMRLAVTG